MRNALILLLASFCLAQCTKNGGQETVKKAEVFYTDVMLKVTPVKTQGNSEFCWIYAMLATIETEHLMQGDSVNLSEVFLSRHYMAEQARCRYAKGEAHKTSMRGMATMTLKLLQHYGAMPYSSCRPLDNVDYKSVLGMMQRTADSNRAHLSGINSLNKDLSELLDTHLGFAPEWVFMLGCQYTPIEFAHSICQADEYVGVTSFTHHPFGNKIILEVPDNHYQDDFLNVPVDSMMAYIDRALGTGHPVCWEGDLSEKGFDLDKGVGRWEDGTKDATQERRQMDFDSQKTTDDHCMEMVGIAHDKKGEKFYILKNSWGKNNPYGGFVFLSEEYVKMKTIAIILPKATLPSADKIIKTKTLSDNIFPNLQ